MGRKCKWHLLVQLEVQDGGGGVKHFSMEEIKWSPIWFEEDEVKDLCTTIPLHRLDAFVAGESKRDDTGCEFICVSHRDHNHKEYKKRRAKMYSR